MSKNAKKKFELKNNMLKIMSFNPNDTTSNGIDTFSNTQNHALINFLDSIGIEESNKIAQQLLIHFGSLSAIMNADITAFNDAGILNYNIVNCIKKAGNLFKACCTEEIKKINPINSIEDFKKLSLYMLREKPTEEIIILFFNKKLSAFTYHLHFFGATNNILINQNEILRTAISLRASNVALMHNHPSGDPTPSQEDLAVTNQLKSKLATLEIILLDHLIIGADSVVSMKQKNLI